MTSPFTTSTKKSPPFIVVSGASGSGKTTICRKIAEDLGLYYSVSHTTRQKRPSEKNGVDYYFVTVPEFMAMVESDDFFEWAKVYDNCYGTSKKIIQQKLRDGQGVILDLDTQGAAQIKKIFPESILIFIDTPSLSDLQKRLSDRATDSSQEIAKRVAYAKNEIAQKNNYDHVVLNDDLSGALNQVHRIIERLL